MAEKSSHNKDSVCSSNLLCTLFIMVVVITTAPHGENNQHNEHGGREKRETDTGLTVTCLLGKFQQSAYSISIDGDMVLDEKTTYNQDFDALAPDVFLWTKENDLRMTCQMSSANLKKQSKNEINLLEHKAEQNREGFISSKKCCNYYSVI